MSGWQFVDGAWTRESAAAACEFEFMVSWGDNVDSVKNEEGAGGIDECVDFREYFPAATTKLLISFFFVSTFCILD